MKKSENHNTRKLTIRIMLFLFGSFLLTMFLFISNTESNAQKKELSKQNIFEEQTFSGVQITPITQKTTTFKEILEFEKTASPPSMEYVLQSKGKRPRNPPAEIMPPVPATILKRNPQSFFDYEKVREKLSVIPSVASPSPNDNFQALNDANFSIPPDTHGAVGPSHLITALNTQLRIQNKTGGTISTVLLNSFFSSVNGGSGTFDPRVLYDQLSNRWIIVAVDDAGVASSKVLIAVSQTTDPTGSWNMYGFDHDATDVEWADFPMVGYNKDWIAISINDFTNAGNAFSGANCYVFDKSTLYAGASTPTVNKIDIGTSLGNVHQPTETFDSSLSTLYILQRWNGGAGLLRIYTITGTVGSPIFTATGLFPATSAWNDSVVAASQNGSSVKIATNDTRMQSVIYRNGSLWATHTIGLPTGTPNRTSVQWWQITPTTGAVTQTGRIDDSTAENFYAFPNIAVNAANQVLISYTTFSSTTFASAAYSYRSVTQATGTSRDSLTYKTGLGCYNKTFGGATNRWGDYSRIAIDPTDDSTFWALQEYAETPVGTPCDPNTGRWGTWWAKLIPPCTSIVASGNWNTAATWGCGSVPTVNDDAVIVNGQTVTLNTNPMAASVTVNSGGTLAVSGTRTASTNIKVNGTLDLTNGILNMNGNSLIIGCNGNVTGASSSGGYVIGNITKEFCSTGSFTYPTGENGYSPMTANILSLSTNPASLTADVVDSTLPDLATNNSASRYWDLTGAGITADLSFTYLDTDVNGSESNYSVFKKVGANPPTNQCPVPCINTVTNTATATNQSSFSQWGIGSLTPSAAAVQISGRVLTSNNKGISQAVVTIAKQNGEVASVITNQFGYYRFTSIAVGETYTFNVKKKGFSFNSQVISVNDVIGNLNFVAQ